MGCGVVGAEGEEGLEAMGCVVSIGVGMEMGVGGDWGKGREPYPCISCFWMNMFSWIPPISWVNLNASHVAFAGACRMSSVGSAATRPSTLRNGRRCSNIVHTSKMQNLFRKSRCKCRMRKQEVTQQVRFCRMVTHLKHNGGCLGT